MTEDEQWSPIRNTETEQQWNARRDREKDKAAKPPGGEGLRWNPFKDLPSGSDRLAHGNEVLAESMRRHDEDIRRGPEANKRIWDEQLRGMLDKGDRGQLPDNFFTGSTDNPDDNDGGTAA